jgi:hypothetical protein
MSITDLRGHLLARKANLAQQGQQATARMLLLEREHSQSRALVDQLGAAHAEVDRTLALLPAEDAKPEAR